MITGSNTNVRHRGMLFHVQTEDSGRAHPHVISHLYCGGTIIASEKRVYADDVDVVADLEGHVRALMESQHKAMLSRLKQGDFDAVIAERLGAVTSPADPADTSPSLDTPRPQAPAVTDTAPSLDTPRPRKPERRAEPAAAPADEASFGGGDAAQKPLDEVILEYLVEKARERGSERREKSGALRGKG